MLALNFGAGSIGRGFIGDLLHESGYEVVFADVNEEIIDMINENNCYYLFNIDSDRKLKIIDNVSGVSIINDYQKVVDLISTADIITTSVWANNLSKLAPVICEGLKMRFKNNGLKVNILACENALHNSQILRSEVLKYFEDEKQLDLIASFADTAVDRLVLESNRMGHKTIDIGKDHELVINKTQLSDSNLKPIKDAIYSENLIKYIERKLYIINGGHSWLGYKVKLEGFETMQEAFTDDFRINSIKEMMTEPGKLISVKYGFSEKETHEYIEFAVNRFMTPGVIDYVTRVCRSPIRKLGKTERFIAPAIECEALGLPNNLILDGVAALFMYKVDSDSESIEIQNYVKKYGIEKAVSHFTGLDKNSKILNSIVYKYNELRRIYG